MNDDLISRKALLEAIDSSFIIPILKINMREEYKAEKSIVATAVKNKREGEQNE